MDLPPIVKCSAGLDVHLKIIVATIVKEQLDGTIIKTTKEFKSSGIDLANLAEWLYKENVELAIMESTGVYWKTVFESLEERKINTYVVNANRVKQIPGKKTDVSDSEWLAVLARHGLVKSSFIPDKDLRELRLITRYRSKLKANIASEVNRMHKVLNDAGIRLSLVFSDLQSVSAYAVIDALISGEPLSLIADKLKGKSKSKKKELFEALSKPLSERHKFLLREIKDHVNFLEIKCSTLEEVIFHAMAKYKKQWEILQTIPGIDKIAAAMIIAETGIDMQQFDKSEKFCAWAGMCPGNNESAGKKKSCKTVKGSPALRKVLCEISNAAVRTRSQFQDYYQSLKIRRGHKRSIIASGHKIARVIFKLLSTNKCYEDPQVNYEELLVKRNAPRWINCLVKYGYIKSAC